MSTKIQTKSAAVREKLTHPIVDADGHMVEYMPLFLDYLGQIAGAKTRDKYIARLPNSHRNYDGTGGSERIGGPEGWYALSPEQRHDMRVARPPFWGATTANMLDRATVMLPKLFRERLDDLGIDFAIVYGSMSLDFLREPDEELRIAGCRAVNTMYADLYGPQADRMAIVAAIPTVTPQEAVTELDYAITKLGLRAAVFGSTVRRPIPFVARKAPELASYAFWTDVLGLASEYDYDPLWKRCTELRIPVASHTSSNGVGYRQSTTNFVYNHLGHFGAAGEAFCKALILGGVTERFPSLTFAFLEGGVGWACNLYNDIIEHWETRNVPAMRKYLDPANFDRNALDELFKKYGEGRFAIAGSGGEATTQLTRNAAAERPEDIDDWKALKIDDPRKFAKIFENFFFGCESEDRMTAAAFNPRLNHFGARLQAMFSSDVGHFDVRDITKVVADAYELVEDDLLSEDDFRDFTFANATKLYAKMNPDFFKGTPVEGAAREVLAATH